MNRDDATVDNMKQFTDQVFDMESEKAASIIKVFWMHVHPEYLTYPH